MTPVPGSAATGSRHSEIRPPARDAAGHPDAQRQPGARLLAEGHHAPAASRPGRRPGPDGLTGLRALITGGSSGIGAATARALAVRGVHVAIAGRDMRALRAVAADTGGICLPGDLRERDVRAGRSGRRPTPSAAWTSWCPTPGSAGPGRLPR